MDRPAIIRKTAFDLRVPPNLADYEAECSTFTWEAARAALQGLPGGGINIAFDAVDKHAAGSLRDRTALRFVSRSAAPIELSYAELAQIGRASCRERVCNGV